MIEASRTATGPPTANDVTSPDSATSRSSSDCPTVTTAEPALARAVRARKAVGATQAAIDAGQSILDLRLRHRPPAEIDRARFELWTQQILVHAASRDSAGVSGDVATLEWIRDRIVQTLEPGELAELDTRLRALRTAADAKRLAAAADHAVRLGQRLRSL